MRISWNTTPTAPAGSSRCASCRAGSKIVVLGLVTSKTGALESKDELKRRIEAASRYLPLEQLALSARNAASPRTEEGNLLTEEQQWAKLRLCVEVAREVWGAV